MFPAAADQKLQDQGLLPSGDKRGTSSGGGMSLEEQQKRVQDMDDIERDEFEPAMFKSSRGQILHVGVIFHSVARPHRYPSKHATLIYGYICTQYLISLLVTFVLNYMNVRLSLQWQPSCFSCCVL